MTPVRQHTPRLFCLGTYLWLCMDGFNRPRIDRAAEPPSLEGSEPPCAPTPTSQGLAAEAWGSDSERNWGLARLSRSQ
jgi:hypothetical protein